MGPVHVSFLLTASEFWYVLELEPKPRVAFGKKGLDMITPPVEGMILPGTTLASCLTLLLDPVFHALVRTDTTTTTNRTTFHPAERGFTMADLERWYTDEMLLEAPCVAAIHQIGFEGRDMHLSKYPSDENGLGPVGRVLRAKILGGQEYEGWGVV